MDYSVEAKGDTEGKEPTEVKRFVGVGLTGVFRGSVKGGDVYSMILDPMINDSKIPNA